MRWRRVVLKCSCITLKPHQDRYQSVSFDYVNGRLIIPLSRQYEIVTGPLSPLKAADAVVLTREAIYNIAAKHGLRATFAPRMFSDNCWS